MAERKVEEAVDVVMEEVKDVMINPEGKDVQVLKETNLVTEAIAGAQIEIQGLKGMVQNLKPIPQVLTDLGAQDVKIKCIINLKTTILRFFI